MYFCKSTEPDHDAWRGRHGGRQIGDDHDIVTITTGDDHDR
jgi:hypothetical protein